MLSARLRQRVPGARLIGASTLRGHALRWHKVATDGSGKCDIVARGSTSEAAISPELEQSIPGHSGRVRWRPSLTTCRSSARYRHHHQQRRLARQIQLTQGFLEGRGWGHHGGRPHPDSALRFWHEGREGFVRGEPVPPFHADDKSAQSQRSVSPPRAAPADRSARWHRSGE
jgi:hypothetical protein